MNHPNDQPDRSLADPQRLTSWKQIASYLGQSVRTAQRWEREDGLPVYRQQKKSRGFVFAYTNELDQWWERQKQSVSESNQMDPESTVSQAPRRFPLTRTLGAVGILATLTLFVAGSIPGTSEDTDSAVAELYDATNITVSPDGEWLAYYNTLRMELRIRSLQTGDEVPFTEEGRISSTAWSRDSEKLAYSWWPEPGADLHIGVIDLKAKGTIRVPHRGFRGEIDEWSADGTRLLAVRTVGESAPYRQQIGFFYLHDGSFESRFDLPAGLPAFEARLSLDERFVAFSTVPRHIYLAELGSDRPPVQVTKSAEDEWNPIWAADGRHILFIQGTPSPALFGVEIDSTGQPVGDPFLIARLLSTKSKFHNTFDTDGAFYVGSEGLNYQCFITKVVRESGLPGEGVYGDFPIGSRCDDWVAEGTRIRYFEQLLNRASPSPALIERDIESGEENLVTSEVPGTINTFLGLPRRMPDDPDARWWYYVPIEDLSWIYRYDAHLRKSERFHEADAIIQSLAVAPTGDYLIFGVSGGFLKSPSLHLLRLVDKAERSITSTASSPNPAWSQDGSRFAFVEGNCLMVMRPQESVPHELTCAPPSDLLPETEFGRNIVTATLFQPTVLPNIHPGSLTVVWHPDGTHVAWPVPISDKDRYELWFVDATTGEHQVAFAGEDGYRTIPMGGGGWSPDGKQFALNLLTRLPLEVRRISNLLPVAP